MRLAIIGRSEYLYGAAEQLLAAGHELAAVVTAQHAPEYRRTADDFRALARSCKAPFVHSPTLDSAECAAAFAQAGPIDLGVSVNFTGIVNQRDIDRFPFGILNAHGGDLPRYRGNACSAWAILNGEPRIGLCIHRMIGGELDSGDIVARAFRPLALADRIGEVLDWIGAETPRLFVDAVARLAEDPRYVLERQSPNPADALRCYPRQPSDGHIDWRQTNEQVLRLINASSEPYAGAFCFYEGERMTIWRARLHVDDERYLAVPGQVAAIDRATGSVVVTCGTGKLRITDVTYRGDRMPPATFISSMRKRLHS